jgi:hypothetical protein
MWLVYYSGYISPAESGKFKFSASADNMITLMLDGDVVAHGCTWGTKMIEGVNWQKGKDGWINLKEDKTYFAEVFIADDGGNMHSRILVEKNQTPGTNIFQVGATPEGLEEILTATTFEFGKVLFKRVKP